MSAGVDLASSRMTHPETIERVAMTHDQTGMRVRCAAGRSSVRGIDKRPLPVVANMSPESRVRQGL